MGVLKRVSWTAGVMAMVLCCSFFVYAEGTKYKTIGVEEVKGMIEGGEKVLIIDARTEEEYRAGHLPEAINVSPRLFPFISGYLPKDKLYPLVFYCRGFG
jgi:predicted sulfurtransferase